MSYLKQNMLSCEVEYAGRRSWLRVAVDSYSQIEMEITIENESRDALITMARYGGRGWQDNNIPPFHKEEEYARFFIEKAKSINSGIDPATGLKVSDTPLWRSVRDKTRISSIIRLIDDQTKCRTYLA